MTKSQLQGEARLAAVRRQFSEHFTMEEFEENSHDFTNCMPADCIPMFEEFCAKILEPIRELLGKPVQITSAYRCPRLNTVVGGVPDSFHVATPLQCAVDFVVPGMTVQAAFDRIRLRSYLAIDKVIHEKRAGKEWLHVQWRRGLPPRRVALIFDNGTWFKTEYRVMAPPVANKELWGEA